MMGITNLLLFSGIENAEADPTPSQHCTRPSQQISPWLTKAGPRVVALTLARDRRLVAGLVEMFRAVPANPQRATTFRREILTPLVKPRIALGLKPEEIEAELNALEEAMVGLMLAGQRRTGNRR